MPRPAGFDALITTHGDRTASLTLYRAGTTDAVLDARLDGYRWSTRTRDGYLRFPSRADAEAFLSTHVPPHRLFTTYYEDMRR